MKPAPRRAWAAVVVAAVLVLLACAAGAWRQAWRQLAEFEALAAGGADEGASHAPSSWAPEESFTFDLQPPTNEIHAYGESLAAATEDVVPPPPPDLGAWLDAHEKDVDDLARRVLDSGPIALTAIDSYFISSRDSTRHVLAVARSSSLLLASSADAARRGDRARANERLEAAWILHVSLQPLAFPEGVSGHGLGAIRLVNPDDPLEWRDRLGTIDVRAEAAGRLAAQARQALRTVQGVADWPTPRWMPSPVARVARRVTMARQAWIQCPGARGDLDARALLLSQSASDDEAARVRPIASPGSATVLAWLPSVRRSAHRERGLAHAAELLTDLRLTRSVLAARAGLADSGDGGDPPFETTVLPDGRIRISALGPGTMQSFTFRPASPHHD